MTCEDLILLISWINLILFSSPVFKEVMRRWYNQRRVSVGADLRALPVQCIVQSLCFTLLQGSYDNRSRIHCYWVNDRLNVFLTLQSSPLSYIEFRSLHCTSLCDPLNNLNGSCKDFSIIVWKIQIMNQNGRHCKEKSITKTTTGN